MNAVGRIAASLRALLFQPGFLTREYFQGRRWSFVSPVALYVGCCVVYFVLNPLLASVTRRLHPPPPSEAAELCASLALKEAPLGGIIAPGGANDSLLLSDIDTTSLSGRLVTHAGNVLCHPESFEHTVSSLLPLLLVLYMPLFAWLMQLVYRARAPSYAANMVFTLHFHAMLFTVLIASDLVSVAGSGILETLMAVAGIIFTSWQYYAGARYAYDSGPSETTWKTTVVGLVYGVCYAAGAIVVLGWRLLRL